MDGSFACPDCGCGIQLEGLSPGRQVQCDWCGSLVEVPFIPRSDQVRRLRRERRRGGRGWTWWRSLPIWARVSATFLSMALVLAVAWRLVNWRIHTAGENVLEQLVASSIEAERSGRLSEALLDMQAVIARAERMNPPPYQLAEHRERRDALARREVEAQLAQLNAVPGPGFDPAVSVGQALTLEARASKDPALIGLQPAIEATLNQLRRRWIAADTAESTRAFEDGRSDRAMELCERRYRTADALPAAEAKAAQSEAAALALKVIARNGVLIEPVKGHFTLGTTESYGSLLRPILSDALLRRGYLPRPARPVWPDLWASHSPYRITFEVNEQMDDTYFQSPNRLSSIVGKIAFLQGSISLWNDTPLARTSVPLPRLPAYQASRVAVSDRRSPDFERLLYENARSNLLDRVTSGVRNLPRCPSSTTTALNSGR
ncbi:MAG: hypothetical protein U0794_13410 [Isosphaeraceae bacterium]